MGMKIGNTVAKYTFYSHFLDLNNENQVNEHQHKENNENNDFPLPEEQNQEKKVQTENISFFIIYPKKVNGLFP